MQQVQITEWNCAVEESNMKIRDLLEVLNTDSVVLARENDVLVDCETPYINQALREYMDEEIERITPLEMQWKLS